jgi:DNA polymerase-3 subunit beta
MPLRTVQEVLRLAGSSDSAKISFDLGKTEARISIDNIELVTRLIEGNFPNYAQIIPSKSASTLKVSRSELIQAARLTGIFARESANTIIIKASDSKLTLHAEAAQIGDNIIECSFFNRRLECYII